MEFIRTLREKRMSSRQKSINEEANYVLCLSDFDGKIYIAYNGTPIVPIEEKWTQKEILNKLEEIRNSYINYKMKKEQLDIAAVL